MPVPPLVSPPLPEMSPRKLVVMLCFTVRVPLPKVMVPPVPERAPTVWSWPLRSKLPPLTVSGPAAARLPPVPSWRMPSSTVVPPL